jgi:hypothetical protein
MENFPIIAIELVMVLGGALLFGWWQFRDLDREAAKRKQEERTALTKSSDDNTEQTKHKT